jgi:ribulose-5-phosphate 4-epimerase/fuculose-1-phosphate aldolase
MKSMRLHPFARRVVASCHQLNSQRLAPGIQSRMTALDETEQLLWITPEDQPFAQLTAEMLSVRSFEGLLEESVPTEIASSEKFSIMPANHFPQRFWERDYRLLQLQVEASVVLQSYVPNAVAWATLVQTQHLNASTLPEDFHALFLSGQESENSELLLAAMQSQVNAAKPTNLIFVPQEAPIILAASPEQAVAQLLWLEAFAQTQLTLSAYLNR